MEARTCPLGDNRSQLASSQYLVPTCLTWVLHSRIVARAGAGGQFLASFKCPDGSAQASGIAGARTFPEQWQAEAGATARSGQRREETHASCVVLHCPSGGERRQPRDQRLQGEDEEGQKSSHPGLAPFLQLAVAGAAGARWAQSTRAAANPGASWPSRVGRGWSEFADELLLAPPGRLIRWHDWA